MGGAKRGGTAEPTFARSKYKARTGRFLKEKLMCVCVFFKLTDRASAIPSNIRGYQSGTRSAGKEKIRVTSTTLQREHENKNKTKNDKNKGTITCQKNIEEGHSIERVWYSASRVPSDTLPGSQPCTQTHSTYNSVRSGFQVSRSTQLTSLRESLGWSK